MMQMIHKMLDWFKSLFWKEEMELTLVGLQHAGEFIIILIFILSTIHLQTRITFRENNICKCDCIWFIQRRHDTDSRLQYEKNN